uniref:DUF2141 domain-containing protein n=1 Tax=Polaribacter sp. TaxID=1920175 RepID=UPI004048B08D
MKLFAAIFTLVSVLQMTIITKNVIAKPSITVLVPNSTSDKGTIHYALFNKKTFMQEPLQAKIANIKNKKSTVVFENIEAGEYAVIIFHDKNKNKKMDFDERGMPLENYGVLNNPAGFGPPQFIDAKFVVVDKNVTLEIRF